MNRGLSLQLLSPSFGVISYWLVTSRGLGIKRRAEAQLHVSLTDKGLFGGSWCPITWGDDGLFGWPSEGTEPFLP